MLMNASSDVAEAQWTFDESSVVSHFALAKLEYDR
jgi:hypothetical protein